MLLFLILMILLMEFVKLLKKLNLELEILTGIELKKLKNAVQGVVAVILLRLLTVNFTAHLLTRLAMRL